jgi:segregation and condensation protein B
MSPRPEAARAIEAILMVAQEPVDPHLLAQLLEVAPAVVDQLCDELASAYRRDERGFVLAKVAGGYRFQSHADLAAYVERFVLEGQTARLSAAALETLAIVAYKQPLSRAQVASIRGVNVDGVMRTLQQRGYVVEVGRDPGPGQATLFGTSQEFLERLGLDSLDDLPPISAMFPNSDVMEALERGLRAEPAPTAEPELPLADTASTDTAETDTTPTDAAPAHGELPPDETVADETAAPDVDGTDVDPS